MPGVLFLPALFYDHRIWADLPASLGADCDAVYYDVLATATAAGAPPPQPGLPWVDRLTAGSYCMDASFMLF